MLLHIREKAQSWIAIAIVGLLILGLSTVAWDAYFSPDPEVPVASVNGEKITSEEFQREYAQQRAIMQSRLRSMLGEDVDISQFIPDEKVFKENVLKRLQEEALAYQATSDAGYRVGDAMLAQQIRSYEAFQTDGQFSPDAYKQWLRQNYYSPGGFEDMLRRDVIVQQLRAGVIASAWVSESERQALLKLQQQERNIEYIVVPVETFMDAVEVSDADASSYFESNQDRYATEEQVSIEYLELAVADLAKDVDVDEETLRETYDDRQSEFGIPEERRTRHILLEVAGDASEEETAAAEQKARDLIAKLRDGGDFVAVAKESSDDFGSANSGGDLGYMALDTMMDPVYGEAAFALDKGSISEPVKSAYGFHIIEVLDIKPGSIKTFEEVRDQLEQDQRTTLAEDKFFEQGEMLANLTFENPDTLEIAADELGLQIKTTGMFGRNFGTEIAMEADVRSSAFSEDVLNEGLNSQPLDLKDGRVVVLRVKEHRASTTRPFDEVKESIIAQLRNEQAQAKAEAIGEEILTEVRESGDLAASAETREYTLEKPEEALTRKSTAVNRELVAKAFQMGYPAEGESIYAGKAMANGDYVVIALREVTDGEAEEAAEQTLVVQRENFYGANDYLGAMADMRAGAEIIDYPDNY